MHTQLAPEYQSRRDANDAAAILRNCVHCGFCTATCPTYQVLGDELDSPRGRIYLIKQVLEGQEPTQATQLHLDRCLTCRNCETTCPSGVQYGRLLDIGRALVAEKVPRPPLQKALRQTLKHGLTSSLFAPAFTLGQQVRGLLPAALQAKVPARGPTSPPAWPQRVHARKVLLLAGCVQPVMSPSINPATARVLDAAGIQTIIAKEAGCCGALAFHLDDADTARAQVRTNIDAWWPYIARNEVEAIIINASGCGVMVKDYGHVLQDDPLYAEKAKTISELSCDISELLPELIPHLQGNITPPPGIIAYHPPCTLQHGQKLRGGVETHLRTLGFDIRLTGSESHLCCGSAGTYSILQPGIATNLRDRKLTHLNQLQPSVITSANIGCITHLQSGSPTIPVRHWIELVDEGLSQ